MRKGSELTASDIVVGETVTFPGWAPMALEVTHVDLRGDGWVWVRGVWSTGTDTGWMRLTPTESVVVA